MLIEEAMMFIPTLHDIKCSIQIDLSRSFPNIVRHGQELVEGTNASIADKHVCNVIQSSTRGA